MILGNQPRRDRSYTPSCVMSLLVVGVHFIIVCATTRHHSHLSDVTIANMNIHSAANSDGKWRLTRTPDDIPNVTTATLTATETPTAADEPIISNSSVGHVWFSSWQRVFPQNAWRSVRTPTSPLSTTSSSRESSSSTPATALALGHGVIDLPALNVCARACVTHGNCTAWVLTYAAVATAMECETAERCCLLVSSIPQQIQQDTASKNKNNNGYDTTTSTGTDTTASMCHTSPVPTDMHLRHSIFTGLVSSSPATASHQHDSRGSGSVFTGVVFNGVETLSIDATVATPENTLYRNFSRNMGDADVGNAWQLSMFEWATGISVESIVGWLRNAAAQTYQSAAAAVRTWTADDDDANVDGRD